MAADQSTRQQALTLTLSGTTAQSVEMQNGSTLLVVVNHSATVTAWVRIDGTTAVADAAGAIPVPTNFGSVILVKEGTSYLSVVGNGNKITVITKGTV